eukprot:NODE_1018_length_2620_cov_0.088854.p1 type:complete len:678 gc:universal NODE_1018_length_2620_cov_0.088854:2509-476(-)
MKSVLKSIFIIYLTMMTHINGISTDCPLVMRFLQGLNMNITDPILYQSIPADCCGSGTYNSIGNVVIYCSGSAPNEQIWYLGVTNLKLNGTIQSQFIPTGLSDLVLYGTDLNTTIPPDLPNTIVSLNFKYNNFYGRIPDSLPTTLGVFDVEGSKLTELPASFPVGITSLYLGDNRFVKFPYLPPIVKSFGIQGNFIVEPVPLLLPSSLIDFEAGQNLINGTIPSNLPNSLVTLYLSNNKLTGSVPDSLPSNLKFLELNYNYLSSLPTAFPTSVSYLMLKHNLFTKMPNLPKSLKQFDISYNLVFDSLPFELPALIMDLRASNNNIYGSIQNLSVCNSLYVLDLSNNNLNGSFPILVDSLQILNLENNLFHGEIPSNLTWPSGLLDLKVGLNRFYGNLSAISGLNSMRNLNLSFNSFSGDLPHLNGSSYKLVDVSHNQLSGEIDLGYTSISDLRLSFNKFDKFPKSLPKSIFTLKLDNNGMSGNMSYDLPSTLTSIDISGNNLIGNIPNWQINSTRDYLNISNNYFIGSISQSLQYVNTLDLSHNHLSGCISSQFKGSNVFFNDNYLSGNLSFMAPSQLSISNNFVTNVVIYNSNGLQKCDLSLNPLAPGVFGKTFQNQCDLNGIYMNSKMDCRILALNETLDRNIEIITTLIQDSNTISANSFQNIVTSIFISLRTQ